jgi:RNA polymerase sigma-70 factor (ECF subfamily)
VSSPPPPATGAPSTDADRELLARLRRGDESAFDAIFRESYARLVRTAEMMLRERAVAEELAQDVMLELWRKRETLDPHGSVIAYLHQATRNRALNHLRHLSVQRRSAPHLLGEQMREASGPSSIVAEEIGVALREALDELTARCREVFELSRVRGLTYSEIANTLGVTVKAVEAQMGKALRTIRERLAPWLPNGDRL